MEPIKSFSNVVIGQFVLTRIPIKVYVNGRYLTITSTDDVQDPLIGFGMDEDGQMQRYDYRTIEHLLVSSNVVDLDTYNKAMGAGGEEGDEEEGGEEGGEEEPTKEESFQMTEISKDVLKAKLKANDLEMKALKDKEKELKSMPVEAIEEESFQGDYTFGIGDIVTNKNKSCAHYGAAGVINKITDLPNDMGQVATYRVTNNGDTFRAGDILTKTLDQLEIYNG